MIFRKILILISAVIISSVAVAQDTKKDKEPEPEIGTLEAAWKPVVMTHYVGIRGGIGSGTARFEPQKITSSYNGLKSFGLFYRFDAVEQKYVGCLEFSLNYMEKGFVHETSFESGEFYSRKYSMIEFPILWQPYLPLSATNSASRIFLNVGPYLGYALKSQYRTYIDETDVTVNEGDYIYNISKDNYFEYGILIGGGFQVAIKRVALGLDFRYNIMLSDIMKNGNKYPGNPFRSPVDQMNLSFSLGYKINRNLKSQSDK